MSRLAYLTTRHLLASAASQLEPFIIEDDLPFVEILRARGHQVVPALWRDPQVDWASFDLVLIRTPWDYQTDARAFLELLLSLERRGIPVLNPPDIVAWNLEKTYLIDLEQRGVPIVPTVLWPRDGAVRLGELLAQVGWIDAGWTDFVLKPVIGAAGKHAFRIGLEQAGELEAHLEALVPGKPFLVQPFRQAVLEEGEWTLTFFEGVFSHSVLKNARAGEFRVQEEHGGMTRLDATAPPDLIRQASRAVEAVGQSLAYARVDGVVVEGRFELMELELIEPELFLRADAEASSRFAEVIEARLAGMGR